MLWNRPLRAIALLALTATMLAAQAGCGGNAAQQSAPAEQSAPAAQPTVADSAAPPVFSVSRRGFTLKVDKESYVKGGTARAFSLEVSPQDDGTASLSVAVQGASALKALYFDVDYDAAQWVPDSAAATPSFAAPDRQIELSLFNDAGSVHHGQILIHPQSQPGFSGDGALASLRFHRLRPGEAPRAARIVSAAPTAPDAVSDLVTDSGVFFGYYWRYYNPGDYNQDGQVSVQDLTPIGINFQAAGPFQPDSVLAVVDGNSDGHILISDLTPIGLNFRHKVTTYKLYGSDNFSDYPASPGEVSKVAPITSVNFSDYIKPGGFQLGYEPTQGRLYFGCPPPNTNHDDANFNYIWVRPADGDSDGTPSFCLLNSPWLATPVPAFHLTVDGVGGDGTSSNPFITAAGGSFQLHLIDDVDGDVTSSPDTVFRLVEPDGTPSKRGSIDATGMLHLDAGNADMPLHVQYYYKHRTLGFSYGPVTAGGTAGGARLKLNGPLVPPVASFTAAPESGTVPLSVHFDGSASSDSDGTLKNYGWVADTLSNDGLYNGTTADHMYTTPGVKIAQLTVRDNDGQEATAEKQITVYPASGDPPAAVLRDDAGTFNTAPLDVHIDASLSLAAQGHSITEYEFDFDGDPSNGWAVDNGAVPGLVHHFQLAGNYTISVRVTDDAAMTSTASVTLFLSASAGSIPVIVLNNSPLSGAAPLHVDFDATGSIDYDGTITDYLWDFDGDNTADIEGPTEIMVSHDYTVAGAFHGSVAVIDNDSYAARTPFVVRVGNPPVAVLPDNFDFNVAPKTILLDASGSSDPNGSIVEYGWDYNNDGTVDETTATPTVSHLFTQSGGVTVRLTVKDNDNLTDFTTAYINFL